MNLKSCKVLKSLIVSRWQRLVAPYKISELVLFLETKLKCHTGRITGVHASAVEQYLESTSVKAVALFAVAALFALICPCLT